MNQPRLLIAEDDEALAALLDEYLSASGYAVSLFHRGDDALQALKDEHFDIVLTDVVMPGVSGLDVLSASHAQPLRTIVLLMTAYSGIEDAIQAIDQGAYDFVSKPFQLPEIRVRLDNAVRYQSLLRQWHTQQDQHDCHPLEVFVQFSPIPSQPDPAALKAYGMQGH